MSEFIYQIIDPQFWHNKLIFLLTLGFFWLGVARLVGIYWSARCGYYRMRSGHGREILDVGWTIMAFVIADFFSNFRGWG